MTIETVEKIISDACKEPGHKRLKKFRTSGFLYSLFWDHFKFPDQSEERELLADIASIETESEEAILDRWCRGHNLIRYAPSILHAVDKIRSVIHPRRGAK